MYVLCSPIAYREVSAKDRYNTYTQAGSVSLPAASAPDGRSLSASNTLLPWVFVVRINYSIVDKENWEI